MGSAVEHLTLEAAVSVITKQDETLVFLRNERDEVETPVAVAISLFDLHRPVHPGDLVLEKKGRVRRRGDRRCNISPREDGAPRFRQRATEG